MKEHGNKTIMCSVLFLDIVEYSKKTVSGQIALKDCFNSLLSTAIHAVPLNDRIILDTGDGAAVSFLGDVEDALKVALSFRQGMLVEGIKLEPPLRARLGINLGPVRLVKDINGQPNIMGDGINVAQRVMGFANDGQILVSRSYFDAVSRLSPDYVSLFHHEGSRTDKHVREHEVYAIGYPGEITAARQKLAADKVSGNFGTGGLRAILGKVVVMWQTGATWLSENLRGFAQASMQQRALFLGVLAIPLLLLAVLLVKMAYHPAPASQIALASVPQATQTEVVPASAVAPTLTQPAKVSKSLTQKQQNTTASTGSATLTQGLPAPSKSDSTVSDIPTFKMSKVRTLEETTAVAPGLPGVVEVTVMPWGEVYLDGRIQGVSPPLTKLEVAPGKHEVEIRNTTFSAYVERVEIKSGEQVKIKHKFAN